MRYLLTPASQRAIDIASTWSLGGSHTGCDELVAPALLLGLLCESECRAAVMLARLQIDADAVHHRWPSLQRSHATDRWVGGPIAFSEEVQMSIQLAKQRLAYLPQPLELATEHLLLGLATADHDVAAWLRTRGLAPDALDAEIHALHGEAELSCRIEEGTPLPEEDETDFLGGDESLGDDADGLETGPSFDPDAPPSRQTEGIAGPNTSWAAGQNPRAMSDRHSNRRAVLTDAAVLRILDAAANRAREGLRVVEDYVRFVLDDRHLTRLCKQMRHDLTATLARLPERQRLTARETQADVGTALTTDSELRREDVASVLAANFGRLQEAVRSLEEFGKVVDVEMAAECKQLRYRVYTIQRAVEITRGSIDRLSGRRLYVLMDGRASVGEFRRLASSLIAAGVDIIQLRDKQLGDRELLERARSLRKLTAESQTLMVVNDRPDLAALAEADGVHVGQEELSVKDARTIVGTDMLIGVSTHNIEQARQAVLDGADYIGVGPTFPSGTKEFSDYPGVELLRAVSAEIRLPAFAIGGIDPGNVQQVAAAGCTRIAVSRAVAAASDPAAAVRALLAAFSPLEP